MGIFDLRDGEIILGRFQWVDYTGPDFELKIHALREDDVIPGGWIPICGVWVTQHEGHRMWLRKWPGHPDELTCGSCIPML